MQGNKRYYPQKLQTPTPTPIPRSVNGHSTLVEIIAVLLVILWIYTGLNKILDYSETRLQMGRSPFIQPIAGFVAIILPMSEILVAVSLVFKQTRMLGFFASFFLMLLFTGYIYIMLHYSHDLPCSCGGVLAKLSWKDHLIFNVIYTVIALAGILLQAKIPKHTNSKRTFHFKFLILVTAVTAVSLTGLLLISAKLPNKQKNGFSRKWLASGIHPLRQQTIAAPVQKICGTTANHIFFTIPDPRWVIMMDTDLRQQDTLEYGLPLTKEMLGLNNTIVDSPYVYFFANNVPAFFIGQLNNRQPEPLHLTPSIFSRSVRISTGHAILRALDSSLKKQSFQKIDHHNGTIVMEADIIENQGEGGFDSDGILQYDSTAQRLFYIQHYRNKFYCIDTNLCLQYVANTIDTIQTSTVSVQRINNKQESRLLPTTPRTMINEDCCADNGHLFIVSRLKADNETNARFRNNTVVDRYKISDGSYVGSFYIPHIKGEKLRSFQIRNNLLVALYKSQVCTFRLDI